MKKLISLILALTMILSLSISAFAANIDAGDNEIDIPASYTAGTVEIVGPDGKTTSATVYSVKLEWTAISAISYDGGKDAYYWDASKLEYVKHEDSSEVAAWNKDSTSSTITVTNRSNAAVKATAAFTAKTGIGAAVTCDFTNNAVTVASAAPTLAELEAGALTGSEKSAQISATIKASGALNSGVNSVGTITVTIESV